MTKFKSSSSSFIVPSIFVIQLIKGPQFLNATGVGLLCTAVLYHLLLKCKM